MDSRLPGNARRLSAVSSQARGTFYARRTRDGEGLRRDGEAFYAVRAMGDGMMEVLFGDGMWMLAEHEDLELDDAAGKL